MRFALYFTPSADHPLTLSASQWLGRDAFSGEALAPPATLETTPFSADRWRELTADPRRYGFHATLKAPFSLAKGREPEELDAAFDTFCSETAPHVIPAVVIRRLGPFFALVPDEQALELNRFADRIVEGFEPFRAPLSEAAMARRKPELLSPRQRELLERYGYPYVQEEFRFHMTLTGPVPEGEADAMERVLNAEFAAFTGKPLVLDGLALFVEAEAGLPFRVARHMSLRG